MRRYLPEWLRRAFHRVGIGLGSSSGSAPPFEPSHERGLIAWYRASDTKAYDQPCLVDGNMEEVSCVSQPALLDGDMELAPPASPTLVDGDMEAADCSAWTASGVGVRAKSTTTPHSGAHCLTLADDGVNNYAWVYQTILTAGHTYRLRGWARGDGTAVPRMHDSSAYIWVGTSSSSWQDIDITFTAGGTQLRLYTTGLAVGSGNHAEFDDLTIEDLTATAWTVSNSVVSKQTGTPHSGSRCLRVAYDGSHTAGGCYQPLTVVGQTYRATGWARGDGTSIPRFLGDGVTYHWIGTSSTDWQYFDVTYTAGNTYGPQVNSVNLSAGHYVEFDDLTIENVSANAWGATQAVVSKSTASPHNGSRALRCAYSVAAAGGAYQGVLTSGAIYRYRGYARGDGTSNPYLYMGGSRLWTGTSSTGWQAFDVYGTAASANAQYLGESLSAGHWVEFDDVSIERVYLADGDMEASGTSYWGTSQVVVSKQTTDPYAGTQCLRVAHDGSHTWGGATQTVLTTGQPYRLRGYYRSSDGVAQLYIADSGAQWLVNGGAQTTWTAFDLIRKAAGTVLNLGASDLSAGQYLEFDGLVLEPAYVVDGDMETAPPASPTLVDGNMEAADCSAWSAYNSATLSKETTTPHGGTKCLRAAYNGSSNPGARQGILTVGHTYRMRGYFRADGSGKYAYAQIGSIYQSTGSTDWTAFDVTGTATDAYTYLYSNCSSAGEYVEFDDVTIEDLTPTAWTAYQAILSKQGSAGSRVLRVAYDGVHAAGLAYQSYLTAGQVYRARGRARGDGTSAPRVLIGTIEQWVGTSSTDWQDFDFCGKANDTIIRLQCDIMGAGNFVEYDNVTVECISASAFTDLSGHTRNANQSTATKQFGVIPDELNGRPVARFDGVDDFCQALFPQGQPVWGIIVAKMTFGVSSTILADGGPPDPSNQLYNNAGTTDLVLYCGSGLTKSGASSATWTVIDYLANGASSGLGLDGGAWATGNAGSTPANGITLGASASGALPATVEIAEAFFYEHSPDAETRRRAVDYCKREYGL